PGRGRPCRDRARCQPAAGTGRAADARARRGLAAAAQSRFGLRTASFPGESWVFSSSKSIKRHYDAIIHLSSLSILMPATIELPPSRSKNEEQPGVVREMQTKRGIVPVKEAKSHRTQVLGGPAHEQSKPEESSDWFTVEAHSEESDSGQQELESRVIN